MVTKRQSQREHEGNDRGHRIPIQGSKRGHRDLNQAAVSGLINVTNGLWMNDLDLYFEPFLRRVVREEVERKIQGHLFPRETINQTSISGAKPLQLCFINELPDTLFTLSYIIATDETPVQIALFDVRTQSIVNEGPLSSIKIEICALNGEFGFSGSEDWTEEEFNANILRERDGKGPLLNGDRFVTLKNGVGCMTKIMFTDNSRWIRSRKFRLGAKVVQPISSEANIKGGRSEPFVVKDNRGASYKKHYPPSLNDDVWRLEKIAKDGKIHKRLSFHGINTVKDLLQLYMTNPSSLYEKAGKIPKKLWLAITEHARACVIDDYKTYIYRTPEQPIGLLFNCIYTLVGVTFDGQNYCSPDTLNPNEKHLVEIVKQHAYQNVNNFKSIDEISLSCLRPLACLREGQVDATDQGPQQVNISTEQLGQQETCPGYGQPFTSTSYIDEGVPNCQIYDNPLPDIREMTLKCSAEGEFFSEMHIEGDSWPLNGSHLPVGQGGYSMVNDSSQFQFTNCCPPCTTWGQENGFYFASSDEAGFSCHSPLFNSTLNISSSGKPKAVWYKIWTALKWVISVRRDAAARRNAKLFYYNY